MQCDAKRAGEGVGADQSPCLVRRGIFIGGAAALATRGISSRSMAGGGFDTTLEYLSGRFQAACHQVVTAEEGAAMKAAFEQATKVAAAMSVIPAESRDAVALKRRTADWLFRSTGYEMQLPFDVKISLRRSATEDEVRIAQ